MFRIIFATVFLVTIGADGKSFTISGSTWRSDIEACASGGEHEQSLNFYVGNFSTYGVSYQEIDVEKMMVTVEGEMTLQASGQETKKTYMTLEKYRVYSYYKEFRTDWHTETNIGLAKQQVRINLTVKFNEHGSIGLYIYLNAGAWWSVSCAKAKAYIDRIKVYVY